jgi:hypothetical protein
MFTASIIRAIALITCLQGYKMLICEINCEINLHNVNSLYGKLRGNLSLNTKINLYLCTLFYTECPA